MDTVSSTPLLTSSSRTPQMAYASIAPFPFGGKCASVGHSLLRASADSGISAHQTTLLLCALRFAISPARLHWPLSRVASVGLGVVRASESSNRPSVGVDIQHVSVGPREERESANLGVTLSAPPSISDSSAPLLVGLGVLRASFCTIGVERAHIDRSAPLRTAASSAHEMPSASRAPRLALERVIRKYLSTCLSLPGSRASLH